MPAIVALTAGGAVLAAMRTWRKELARASELNESERQQRVADLKAERSAALRQLTLGAATLQMESDDLSICLLYTSPSPRDQRGSRMPSSA